MSTPRFTDSAGRTWLIEITGQTVCDLIKYQDVDLRAIFDPDARVIERLTTDVVLLCNVLYVMCKQDCARRGVTDEDFGRSMNRAALDAAEDAIYEALLLFFPRPRQQMLLRTLLGTLTLVKIASSLSRPLIGNDGHTNSPELSESIPEALASVN